jgi:hypothetical protein
MKGGGARFNFPHPAVVGVGLARAAIIAAGGLLFGSWLDARSPATPPSSTSSFAITAWCSTRSARRWRAGASSRPRSGSRSGRA